jgi:hypothetical protein
MKLQIFKLRKIHRLYKQIIKRLFFRGITMHNLPLIFSRNWIYNVFTRLLLYFEINSVFFLDSSRRSLFFYMPSMSSLYAFIALKKRWFIFLRSYKKKLFFYVDKPVGNCSCSIIAIERPSYWLSHWFILCKLMIFALPFPVVFFFVLSLL